MNLKEKLYRILMKLMEQLQLWIRFLNRERLLIVFN